MKTTEIKYNIEDYQKLSQKQIKNLLEKTKYSKFIEVIHGDTNSKSSSSNSLLNYYNKSLLEFGEVFQKEFWRHNKKAPDILGIFGNPNRKIASENLYSLFLHRPKAWHDEGNRTAIAASLFTFSDLKHPKQHHSYLIALFEIQPEPRKAQKWNAFLMDVFKACQKYDHHKKLDFNTYFEIITIKESEILKHSLKKTKVLKRKDKEDEQIKQKTTSIKLL